MKIYDRVLEKNDKVLPCDCLKEINKRFSGKAYIYVILDYAVALGIYQEGKLFIGFCENEGCAIKCYGDKAEEKISLAHELFADYVRELRVFDEKQELRFVRLGQEFFMRFWRDREEKTETQIREDKEKNFANVIYCSEEIQKIWGKVKKYKKEDGKFVPYGWCLLESNRGSKILVPDIFDRKEQNGNEKALIIREYIQFPDASDEIGLVKIVDERMCGLCDWKEERNDADEERQ